MGPIKESTTGSSKNPLAIAKIMIPNHILKNVTKMYDFDPASTEIARNVEKPPWKTLEPI